MLAPTDIEKVDQKLYIALSEDKKVIIFDLHTSEIERELTLPTEPYEIAIAKNQLIFTGKTGFQKVYQYDLNEEEMIGPIENGREFYEPALLLDERNNYIYIGESNVNSATLFAVTFDGSERRTIHYHFPYAPRKLFIDENFIYYDGVAFRRNIAAINGQIFDPMDAINYQDPYVFYDNEIITTNNYLSYLIPYEATLAFATSDRKIVIYSEELQAILFYDQVEDVNKCVLVA